MRVVYLSNYFILFSILILLAKVSIDAVVMGRLDGIMYSVAYAKSVNEDTPEPEIENGKLFVKDEEIKETITKNDAYNELFSELSSGDRALLLSLKSRAKELNSFEKSLYDKEAMLEAVEANFENKLIQMKALKDDLIQIVKNYKGIRGKRLEGVVKVYENMKAQEAARIFEGLESDTLLGVVRQMSERKLAAILAKMGTKRAKEITVMLANMYKFKKHNNECFCFS